jgi:predicted transcriptional regulator of viral defense system
MFVLATVERIVDLADRHAGYFTASEALAAGVSRRVLSHHVATGMLERVAYGIYRLHRYPAGRLEDLVVVGLWAGDDAAISHESALVVYDLGEAMPAVTHLTVPRVFRGRRRGVIVHHAPLAPGERVLVDAVAVTSPERTLLDIVGSADRALVEAAARDALDRGLTTRRRLGRAFQGNDVATTVLAGVLA